MWILLGGAALALAYYFQSQPQPTPLSIYPEFAYTATPAQAKMLAQPASPFFSSVQAQEQSAVLAQCAGGTVCSPLMGDTQLGF